MNKQTKQLMKENNDLSFHLKAADNKILTDMVVYIRGADISGYQYYTDDPGRRAEGGYHGGHNRQ